MKTLPAFFKFAIIVFVSAVGAVNDVTAQKNGILPLTGLRYFSEGITARKIDVKIDAAQLLNNRIPLNKEIEIAVQYPEGFVADNSKTFFAAAEVMVLSPKGEVLMKEANVLAKNIATGFAAKDAGNFNIKFLVPAALMKNNFNGTVKIRLYDMKGKSQLRLELPVTFARQGEQLQVSKSVSAINCSGPAKGVSCGLRVKNMLVNTDTTIRVSPKMAYTSVDISSIKGSSMSAMFEGKESFWVYDSDLNEVKISDILLKKVKGALESDMVDYTLKIPYRLKAATSKAYTVRYRWESADKRQVIDLVAVN